MKPPFLLLSTLLLFVTIQYVHSQSNSNSKIDSLNKEIQILKLKSQIDSLKLMTKTSVVTTAPIVDLDYEARQDAFKKDFVNLQNEFYDTKMNLDLCHKKFRIGLILEVAGYASIVLGTLLIISAASTVTTSSSSGALGQGALGGILYLAGAGGIVAGHFVMIDSHKYIGYAGKRRAGQKSPNLYTK